MHPPALPISLYSGKVMHARLKPKPHRFTYRITSILVDIDRLAEAAEVSPLFSVNGANFVSFNEKHHGHRDGSSLRTYVDDLHDAAGMERPHRIELLCYPTVLGHTFNPLSVYFCYDARGAVGTLIYQVHNTFGDDHAYFEPVRPGQAGPAGIRQACAKTLHVSPFLEMNLSYHFRVKPPEERTAIRILEHDREGPVLAAAFSGKCVKAGTWSLIASVLQCLGITWKVSAGIHFEAMRLWLKGLKIYHRPDGTKPANRRRTTRRTVS